MGGLVLLRQLLQMLEHSGFVRSFAVSTRVVDLFVPLDVHGAGPVRQRTLRLRLRLHLLLGLRLRLPRSTDVGLLLLLFLFLLHATHLLVCTLRRRHNSQLSA